MTHFLRSRRVCAVVVAILLCGMAVGCSLLDTRIAAIRKNPETYLDREVTVSGEVIDSLKIPMLPGFYTLDDGSGTIKVITDRQPPFKGGKVRLVAKVRIAATVEGKPVGLHLQELRRY
jgi:hypothetical protein